MNIVILYRIKDLVLDCIGKNDTLRLTLIVDVRGICNFVSAKGLSCYGRERALFHFRGL